MIGEAFGNYRLVAQIGSGSMGVVFLAEHQRIARRAAIKFLTPELLRDQRALQRFFNEARATSLIRHPGIVDVYDCDVDAAGRAYMVMEHLEGETLAERLRRGGRLHWSAACLIARRVADALGAAHDNGIVHRDLKPENLFLVRNGRDPTAGVKVLDFGVAKLLTADAVARLTVRGMLVGTPEYMSPEQCSGDEVDHRADIYALGCILFEMLTAQPPFVESTVRELVAAHRFRPVPSVLATCPDLPEWLDHLLARMLAKETDRRPPSMHEVSKALCEYKTQRWATPPVKLPPVRPVQSVQPAKDLTSDSVARPVRGPAPPVATWVGAHRREATIAVAAMFVVASAVWAVRRNQAGARPPVAAARAVELPPGTAARMPALTDAVLNAGANLLPAAAERPPKIVPPPANTRPAHPSPSARKPERPAAPGPPARPAGSRPRRGTDADGIVDL